MDPHGQNSELLNQNQWEKAKDTKQDDRREACLKLVERVGGAALALKEIQHDARYDSRASMVVHANTNRDLKLTLGRRVGQATPKSISSNLLAKSAPPPPALPAESGPKPSTEPETKAEPRTPMKILIPRSPDVDSVPRNSLLSSPNKPAAPTPEAVALVDSFLDLLDDPEEDRDMDMSPYLSSGKTPPPPPMLRVESSGVFEPAPAPAPSRAPVLDDSSDDEPLQG